MKTRSRYGCLVVIFIIAVPLALGAWPSFSGDVDNQPANLFVLLSLLAIVCVYAASGANWLVAKIRRSDAPVEESKDNNSN